MTARQDRLAEARGYAGYRQARFARETGTMIVVLDGDAADLDTAAGRWQTVCDDHGTIISHETLALARWHASNPLGWCEICAGTDTIDDLVERAHAAAEELAEILDGTEIRDTVSALGYDRTENGVVCRDCDTRYEIRPGGFAVGGDVLRSHRRNCTVRPEHVPVPIRCNA